MENRVRDLEQLEERDPEDRGRRLGTVLMATLGMVGLTFAMGVVVGKAAEPRDQGKKDPLDQLDRVVAVPAAPSAAPAKEEARVEATELTFPTSLTEDEDRPEVIAALEAAAREEESLGGTNSAGDQALAVANDMANDELDAQGEPNEIDELRPEERMQGTLPAAVAAGSSGQKLAKAAKHDQLVAAALPSEEARELVPHGEEGEYTLQVISYDSSAPAQAFASGLRAKGHEAFVTAADVPDRGRYYRVRIGPFKTRERAETYRSKFEVEEQMNTIVVKRSKDEG